jgi:hypothetical protein
MGIKRSPRPGKLLSLCFTYKKAKRSGFYGQRAGNFSTPLAEGGSAQVIQSQSFCARKTPHPGARRNVHWSIQVSPSSSLVEVSNVRVAAAGSFRVPGKFVSTALFWVPALRSPPKYAAIYHIRIKGGKVKAQRQS